MNLQGINQVASETDQPVRSNMECGRLSTRVLIEEKIKRHQHKIVQLQSLYKSLPLQLPPEADEYLYSCLVRGD